MRTIPIILLLFIFSMLPFSTGAQTLSSPEIPQVVTEEEVRQFIEEYRKRLILMDLDAYMALFSKNAVENRMLPYADIREAYRRTIANTHLIYYHVTIYFIRTYTHSAFVSGRYHIIRYPIRGWKSTKSFKGRIQWDLVRENGSLKIKAINYGRER